MTQQRIIVILSYIFFALQLGYIVASDPEHLKVFAKANYWLVTTNTRTSSLQSELRVANELFSAQEHKKPRILFMGGSRAHTLIVNSGIENTETIKKDAFLLCSPGTSLFSVLRQIDCIESNEQDAIVIFITPSRLLSSEKKTVSETYYRRSFFINSVAGSNLHTLVKSEIPQAPFALKQLRIMNPEINFIKNILDDASGYGRELCKLAGSIFLNPNKRHRLFEHVDMSHVQFASYNIADIQKNMLAENPEQDPFSFGLKVLTAIAEICKKRGTSLVLFETPLSVVDKEIYMPLKKKYDSTLDTLLTVHPEIAYLQVPYHPQHNANEAFFVDSSHFSPEGQKHFLPIILKELEKTF